MKESKHCTVLIFESVKKIYIVNVIFFKIVIQLLANWHMSRMYVMSFILIFRNYRNTVQRNIVILIYSEK